MKSFRSVCETLVCALGLCSSCAIESGKGIVTQIDARRLLGAVAGASGTAIALVGRRGETSPINDATEPNAMVVIARDYGIQRCGQSHRSLAATEAESRGPRYRLMKSGQCVGEVQVGIFSSRREASCVFDDHLWHTSVGPDRNLTGEFGTKAVGWSYRREGHDLTRILFRRDNVVVSVSVFLPRLVAMGGSTKTAIVVAKTIDSALAQGTHGVLRAEPRTASALFR